MLEPTRQRYSRAHAAPQGLCENLINALKLLANQQSDGDSPIQSFVAGLYERNRKGNMDGLRSLIEIDNRSAVKVGQLREGFRPSRLGGPNFEDECPEAIIRDGPDELTLRAEEFGAQRSCINIDHIDPNRWEPPLVDAVACFVPKHLQGYRRR